MKQRLTLYVGDQSEHMWLIRLLDEWSTQHPEIDFSTESVHIDPARAVQLRITRLPALVFKEHIVAQGDPITWVPRFLDQVLFDSSYRDD